MRLDANDGRARMKVGVVTVAFNSRKVIDGFLSSLWRQTHSDFVLYVVDNESRDDTVEHIRRHHDPRIKIIANQKNTGAAEGNNQGIRAALADGCEAILMVNNDTEFSPDLLENLLTALREEKCEMVAPKILFYDPPNVIWSAGGGFYPSRGYASYLYGHGETDKGQFDTSRFVENAPTTCLLVHKKVFERIGLLDSRYFAYVEDTDFCYRAKLAGLKLLYLPRVTLLHKAHSLTGGLLSNFMMRYTTRNRVYFMLKHLGRIRALYFVCAYQVYLVMQFLLRKIGGPMFWVREKGFFEGLRVWRESLAEN
jgi:GT2 family glycosyltransferase